MMRALDELEGYDRTELAKSYRWPRLGNPAFSAAATYHEKRLARITALRVKIYNREDYRPAGQPPRATPG